MMSSSLDPTSSLPRGVSGRWFFLIFALPGLIGATVLTYSAWKHNPGGRFHGPDGIDWVELVVVGFGGFCFAGGLPLAIALIILLFERVRGRRE